MCSDNIKILTSLIIWSCVFSTTK